MEYIKNSYLRRKFLWIMVLVFISCQSGEKGEFKTHISIKGEKWYINENITNQGSPAEGLLMNVRMVNAVFEDKGEGWKTQVDAFDPDENTQRFIEKI